MSDQKAKSLNNIATLLGILIGVGGAVKAWAIMPYEIEANKKAIAVLQQKAETDHEILVRIEERLKNLQKESNK